MSSRTRIIVTVVITLAWFGLAVASFVRGAMLLVPICYVVCGVVMAFVVSRLARPSGSPRSAASADPAIGRARRSGNPAVRAAADTDPDRRS